MDLVIEYTNLEFKVAPGKMAIAVVAFETDNEAIFSLEDIEKFMRYIATSEVFMPDGIGKVSEPVVLMQGKETLTYYVIRKSDVHKYIHSGVVGVNASVYHVEELFFQDITTKKCPECGCTSPFALWNAETGKRLT